MNKHYFLKVLIFALLPSPFIWASPEISKQEENISIWENNKKHNTFSWKNIRLNLHFPLSRYPEMLAPSPQLKVGINKKEVSINKRSSLNLSLEMLAVYNFIITPHAKRQFSLETGIAYNFPKPIEIREFNIVFTEDYMRIPICFKIRYNVSSYFSFSGLLGWEFDILLNSTYKQSGYYSDLPTAMRGNKNVRKILPDIPLWWSTITWGLCFEFSKGIYIEFPKIRIPIGLTEYKLNYYAHNSLELDRAFVDLMRHQHLGTITFDIGINIIKWFFPEQVYY
ncbi:MAG: hypothetical protein ACYC2U_00325 [Candidatus Amoebophilus sp.]